MGKRKAAAEAEDDSDDGGHAREDGDGGGGRCPICLSGEDSGELLQRGCCCRGDGGLVHLECITQLATHRYTQHDDWGAWQICGTCKEGFTGEIQLGLAHAWMRRVEALPAEEERALRARYGDDIFEDGY